MRRRKASNGPAFPFLPVPKALRPAVPVKKAVSNGLIKVVPSAVSAIVEGPVSSAGQLALNDEDAMRYSVKQTGVGFSDQRAFQIQKTQTGWQVCAMWRAEGTGEIPKFLEALGCNAELFSKVFDFGLRLKPNEKTVINDGGLFLEKRMGPNPISQIVERIIGTVQNKLEYFQEDDFFEEDEFMT
jgi:hypothetical protein